MATSGATTAHIHPCAAAFAVSTSAFNPVTYPTNAPGWVYDPTGK